MLNNIAIWAHWRLQAKKDMESHTDPIDSLQLNIQPICIFEYGNQLYNYITHWVVILYNCDPYDIR